MRVCVRDRKEGSSLGMRDRLRERERNTGKGRSGRKIQVYL